MLRGCAFLFLLLVTQLHADPDKYTGPVVCTGTKPLIIHENYDTELNNDGAKKQYYEQYWYQIYNHLHGCEIIIGNLIIPHQHEVPFESDRLNEAIKSIEIVTGFIYIFDVGLDLNFANLKMVYGNELFKYPRSWSGYTNNKAFNEQYAIFVERFTGESILMPELRYIKQGNIGFKNSAKTCSWNPKLGLLDFDQIFDVPGKQQVYALDTTTFSGCASYPKVCAAAQDKCEHCFVNKEGFCQKTTKQFCTTCRNTRGVSRTYCHIVNPAKPDCCPEKSHGGCSLKAGVAEPFYCEKDYFLVINTTNLEAPRKCAERCNGKTINGTGICLDDSPRVQACPDYMVSFEYDRKCSYHCPDGQEFDPISNFEDIRDDERDEKEFKKYWGGKNKCKPCRMIFDQEAKDFKDDCGPSCVIQSNSLSFVTILNIYPAITEIADYDLTTFTKIFYQPGAAHKVQNDSIIFKQKCRRVLGFLHIDQYSVGYPANGKRLIPEHFRVLTYATGLYGSIRIENTEGYWFAEPFRNLLVISKPIQGRIALDQTQFKDNAVTVRYNSDLRTVDLQRLQYVEGNIVVQYNPLYIPPRKYKDNNPDVLEDVFYFVNKNSYNEIVSENGLIKTRTGNSITYDPGCADGEMSFYYKRCIKCGRDELRAFVQKQPKAFDIQELFAECVSKSECDTTDGYYIVERDGEEQCLKCNKECESCKDQTPFTCFKDQEEEVLSCKSKIIDGMNVHACGESGLCLAGFQPKKNDPNQCVRCDGPCFTCYDDKKDANGYSFYSVPKGPATNPPKRGCRGCGVAFLAKQADGSYAAVCGGASGAASRCPPGVNCNYFVNNPVRDIWKNLKPSKPKPVDPYADYGEQK